MIVEGRGVKSAVLEAVLPGGHVLRVADCHLLASVPGELDRFSEFTGDGSLEATFPEQGVYRLDLIPVCGAERHRGQHDNRVGRARLRGQRRPGPGQRLRQSPGSYTDV